MMDIEGRKNMYAVEMFFSEEIEDYVRQIWYSLAEENLDSSLISIKEIKPHITLATYESLQLESFKKQFISFIEKFEPIDVNFVTLGTFPATGACFLIPTMTEELLRLHKNYHKKFEQFNDSIHIYYLPNNWNPHCSLAVGLDNNKLVKVFEHCLKKFKILSGKIIEIGLVEVKYKNNKCVSSPRIL